jgi:hypothetical protein
VIAVSAAQKTHEKFARGAHTRPEINERLAHWYGLLAQHDKGLVNRTLTRPEILRQIDRWLDESNELKGL